MMLVLRGSPVAHYIVLWYAMVRGCSMESWPVHHAGEAQSIFGRMRVSMMCYAMWVFRPLDQGWSKRRELRADFPADAANRVCWMNVRDSSILMPRYLMLLVGVLTWLLTESCGNVDRSMVLWWLALGRQCRSSDFGGENHMPRCFPHSVWYLVHALRHCSAMDFELADWRKLVSSM